VANSTAFAIADATPELEFVVQMLRPQLIEMAKLVGEFRKQEPTPERTFEFETKLAEASREGNRSLVEGEFNRIEPGEMQDCPVRLRFAGVEYKRRPKSTNTIGTLFGPIQLRRYLYEPLEPGEKCIFPLELCLGIEAGLATPALAERIGFQAVSHTQKQVRDWLIRDHGVKWSAKSLRKLLNSLRSGQSSFRQEAQAEKLLKLLKKAARSKGAYQPVLAAGRDGIMVPMRGGKYREASTATVSIYDRKRKRLGTVYLGQMPQAGQGELTDQLTELLKHVLQEWRGELPKLVFITDAGDHPTRYYKEVLSRMEDPHRPAQRLVWQWVVDFWHACGYVAKLKESLFGDKPAGWTWFKKMRHWLKHRRQGLADVLRSATQLRNRRKRLSQTQKELFEEGYGYLRRHARWMAYARYRQQGLPIGSGVTEAACKTVFSQRLKQSGMTWTVEGGQVIIDLRVLVLSGVWTEVHRAYLRARPMPEPVKTGSLKRGRKKTLKIAA
jgi:hypothetical protein